MTTTIFISSEIKPKNELIVFSINVNGSVYRSLRAYRNLWITQYTERKREAIKLETKRILK